MRLTRAMAGAGLGAVVLLAAGQQAALAGGPGGGTSCGNVSCGQSYSPSCTVSAGSGPAAGTPSPKAATPPGPGAGSTSGSERGKAVPAGCRNTAARLACPAIANVLLGGAGGVGAPAPVALAELAREYLVLPSPVIVSPRRRATAPQRPSWPRCRPGPTGRPSR